MQLRAFAACWACTAVAADTAAVGSDLFITMLPPAGGESALALARNITVDMGYVNVTARRTAVHAVLAAAAAESQRDVLSAAAAAGVDCTGFWIVDAIVCRSTPASFEEVLRSKSLSHRVHAVRPLGGLRRFQPVGSSAPLGELPADAGWNVNIVGAPEAWAHTRGEGVVVAVIDGGVRHTHEALVDSYRGTVSSAHGGPNFDYDYNWFDPVYKSKTPEGSDTDGHGTHVTGTVAGAKGIGAAPGAKWIHAKACNYAGYCSDDWAIETAQWVMCPTPVGSTVPDCSKGANVVSCSWGNEGGDDDYMLNVTEAWETAGILGVFADGNDGPDCASAASPADYPQVLGVGATDKHDALVSFSSRGPSANSKWAQVVPALVAPGLLVPSAYYDADDSYYHLSGTSQACPLVAGTAALVKAANPAMSPAQVRAVLAASAFTEDLVAPADGKPSCGGIEWSTFPNHIYGHGRLNASAAVRQAVAAAAAAATKSGVGIGVDQ
jgi:subtilisin family serine protease